MVFDSQGCRERHSFSSEVQSVCVYGDFGKVPDRNDPGLLARIAFGISSPRVTVLKLSKDLVFGSMDDHEFMVSTLSINSFECPC